MTIFSYDEALGYKLQIAKRDGSEVYYTFDSIEQREGVAQPINVQDMHLNINSTMSNCDFIIEDSAKTVDRTKVGAGALIIIQYGKHTGFWSNPESFAYMGYIDYPTPMRPDTNMNEIRVQSYEKKKGLYDTMMNFERSSPLGEITDPSSQKGGDYSLRAHIRRLLEKEDHTVLEDISVEDRFNLSKDISHNLDIVIPNVVYNYVSAGDILDDLCNKIGAVWYIDYKGGVATVKADYPVNMRKPITIKNGPKPVPMTDDPKKTGYIIGPFMVPSTSAAASGHATRLFGLTKIDRHVVASSEIVTHSTTLTNKAIYQPFTTNEIRFNGLDFTCSKKGNPSSPKNRLNGAIYINKVVSGVNMPDVELMEWHVPLDQIKSSKTVVHVELDDIRTRFIDENVTFGIGWGQRSGIDEGDPNTDENNTILIYRDNTNTGGSSIAAKGDLDSSKLVWKANGPKYNYSITSALNRVFAVTNYTAAEKVGFIEPQPIDLNVIDDANIALRFLGNVLNFASLYKGEPQFTVTHPDDFVFKPYQTIRFSDLLSYPAGLDLELHEIDIMFNQNTNEISLGGIVYVDDAWPTNWPCAQII